MANEERLIAEIQKRARENQELAKRIADWMDTTQGRPGTLENNNDDHGFGNFIALFDELRGKAGTSEDIHLAIQRITGAGQGRFSKGKGTLHFVPEQARVNPRQHTNDDPTRKTGQFIDPRNNMVRTSDGGWRNKNAAEQAADRRATEEANNEPQVSLSESDRTWKAMAENLLRDGTHSQQARVKAVFESEQGKGGSWRRIFEACQREVNFSKNRSFVR